MRRQEMPTLSPDFRPAPATFPPDVSPGSGQPLPTSPVFFVWPCLHFLTFLLRRSCLFVDFLFLLLFPPSPFLAFWVLFWLWSHLWQNKFGISCLFWRGPGGPTNRARHRRVTHRGTSRHATPSRHWPRIGFASWVDLASASWPLFASPPPIALPSAVVRPAPTNASLINLDLLRCFRGAGSAAKYAFRRGTVVEQITACKACRHAKHGAAVVWPDAGAGSTPPEMLAETRGAACPRRLLANSETRSGQAASVKKKRAPRLSRQIPSHNAPTSADEYCPHCSWQACERCLSQPLGSRPPRRPRPRGLGGLRAQRLTRLPLHTVVEAQRRPCPIVPSGLAGQLPTLTRGPAFEPKRGDGTSCGQTTTTMCVSWASLCR